MQSSEALMNKLTLRSLCSLDFEASLNAITYSQRNYHDIVISLRSLKLAKLKASASDEERKSFIAVVRTSKWETWLSKLTRRLTDIDLPRSSFLQVSSAINNHKATDLKFSFLNLNSSRWKESLLGKLFVSASYATMNPHTQGLQRRLLDTLLIRKSIWVLINR